MSPISSLNEELDDIYSNQLEPSHLLAQLRKVVGDTIENNNRAYVCFSMQIHASLCLDCFDRDIWPPKQPNAAPSKEESRAVMEILEEQESLVLSIERLRVARDAEHQRLSSKATMLQETLKHMEYLNRLGRTVQSGCFHQLDTLSKALLDMETKRDSLHPLFDGTTATLDSLTAVNNAITLLKSTIETAFGQLPNFFAVVARESNNTELLCAQITDAIASISGMASIALRGITNKQNGVLHPLRRLPEEILLQIFEHCADEEAQKWFEYGFRLVQNPKFLTRMAGVCRHWRNIALGCPRLWRRVLAPAFVTRWTDCGRNTTERGIDHFRHGLQLCKGVNLELTIPHQSTLAPDMDITTLEVQRLNILDASQTWPPVLPSPKHLWLGQDPANEAISREPPLSMLSNTSQITSFCISLTFARPISTVTHLVLCGRHPNLPLSALLCSLPQLVILDARNARFYSTLAISPVQLNIHSQLRTFGVGGTGLAYLEQALVEGLQLPKLHLFEIATVSSKHLASEYPSIRPHMSKHITHLGIFGACDEDGEALHTFIDIFPHLDTLSLHDAMTEPTLQALCRAANNDGDDGGLKCSMPKTVQSVIICDYQGDGAAIHQQLHEIHAIPAPSGESIKIVFQDCLNIRPDIRKELCSSQAIQQTG